MSILPDNILIQQYLSGNNEAFETLLNRYKQRIYSFIYSKIKDRELADDVFQDTFIKVIKTLKKGTYNDEGRFLSWVMRIAHNLIVDHFRRKQRMPMYESHDSDKDVFYRVSEPTQNIEDLLINTQIKEDLNILINELPKNQLEVLHMRLYQDMSFKEIAERTNVSINTSLGRMRYGLINLRKLIDERNLTMTQ
ncbi:MAG: RNA polymerase sigma factor CarQ [Flavobacteriales bacterium]|jgi:RNA polymerase sigma-70 factor (ECF subfamily)|nr:MAG: RNA polymerase subunit sigma-24 [Flavobacteriales bacterium]RPF73458.1 MAG: sigma-70 family RNA polymerase sigma factor [Thiotrichales bacterium TMED285]CAI8281777.1 MAG: RNA polymerase sigma factor CarQ [Flavobacteriales bacterium]|tara:strand:+ start:14915 stop:15496 length:582 start_codon:yes stop_codon:yes gene_type:complete